MRNKGSYDVDWFYEYYLQNGGARIERNIFSAILSKGDLKQIINHLDKKYELTLLEKTDGTLIKVIN